VSGRAWVPDVDPDHRGVAQPDCDSDVHLRDKYCNSFNFTFITT
jgi:hypothetical protein